MITHIQGKLVEKKPTDVVIDCNGVGYQLHISLHTYSLLPESENVKLFSHLVVKEDAHTLYGFADPFEREIFRMLISVSGVGAGTARTMLSSLSPNQIKEAIASNNIAVIQSVKGIGTKTAQRVVIDLKDKVVKVFELDNVLQTSSNTNKDEALSALETLGFSKKQVEKICSEIVAEKPDATVEMIIKLALKKL
ncbi:MAG TPA: Holliday junction branch migration protein RuvA [Flavobacteriaceae bacterium]|nr:Holliday junction branch migration protein RuvA [Flavobacteriaceae bacterium]